MPNPKAVRAKDIGRETVSYTDSSVRSHGSENTDNGRLDLVEGFYDEDVHDYVNTSEMNRVLQLKDADLRKLNAVTLTYDENSIYASLNKQEPAGVLDQKPAMTREVAVVKPATKPKRRSLLESFSRKKIESKGKTQEVAIIGATGEGALDSIRGERRLQEPGAIVMHNGKKVPSMNTSKFVYQEDNGQEPVVEFMSSRLGANDEIQNMSEKLIRECQEELENMKMRGCRNAVTTLFENQVSIFERIIDECMIKRQEVNESLAYLKRIVESFFLLSGMPKDLKELQAISENALKVLKTCQELEEEKKQLEKRLAIEDSIKSAPKKEEEECSSIIKESFESEIERLNEQNKILKEENKNLMEIVSATIFSDTSTAKKCDKCGIEIKCMKCSGPAVGDLISSGPAVEDLINLDDLW